MGRDSGAQRTACDMVEGLSTRARVRALVSVRASVHLRRGPYSGAGASSACSAMC